MVATATFVRDITRMCPITKLYSCSDGQFVLVTVKEPELMPVPPAETLGGIPIIINESQAPRGAEVFRSDARGRVLDADGDPANGMTPLATLDDGTSFEAALSAVGYELVAA